MQHTVETFRKQWRKEEQRSKEETKRRNPFEQCLHAIALSCSPPWTRTRTHKKRRALPRRRELRSVRRRAGTLGLGVWKKTSSTSNLGVWKKKPSTSKWHSALGLGSSQGFGRPADVHASFAQRRGRIAGRFAPRGGRGAAKETRPTPRRSSASRRGVEGRPPPFWGDLLYVFRHEGDAVQQRTQADPFWIAIPQAKDMGGDHVVVNGAGWLAKEPRSC